MTGLSVVFALVLFAVFIAACASFQIARRSEAMKTALTLTAGLSAAMTPLALTGCDDRPDQWDAYVYPGDDLIEYQTIRGFKTFELCQAAAIDRLRMLRPDGGGDYECGYRCAPSPDVGGLNVCKETRK